MGRKPVYLRTRPGVPWKLGAGVGIISVCSSLLPKRRALPRARRDRTRKSWSWPGRPSRIPETVPVRSSTLRWEAGLGTTSWQGGPGPVPFAAGRDTEGNETSLPEPCRWPTRITWRRPGSSWPGGPPGGGAETHPGVLGTLPQLLATLRPRPTEVGRAGAWRWGPSFYERGRFRTTPPAASFLPGFRRGTPQDRPPTAERSLGRESLSGRAGGQESPGTNLLRAAPGADPIFVTTGPGSTASAGVPFLPADFPPRSGGDRL